MRKHLLFLQHRNVSHTVEDQARSVREFVYGFSCGYTGKYKNCVKACLNTGNHIITASLECTPKIRSPVRIIRGFGLPT